MKWMEISILTTQESTEAIASIFHDLGASGVVIEDPQLVNEYRASGAWDYCDLPEAEFEGVTVKAYLPAENGVVEELQELHERIARLHEFGLDLGLGTVQCREVEEEDWADSWKKYFHPIKVGRRVVIKPTWQPYLPEEADEVVIEIDPGMAFGTGTHHTTASCILCLEDYITPGCTVLDVGTGSGILAVVAAKLGAAYVQAVDYDAVAVRVAHENIVLNKVENKVSVQQGDLLQGIDQTADVLLANIVADVILRLLPEVPARINTGGVFIASGIIEQRFAEVSEAMLQQDFVLEKIIEDAGWVTVVARKGGA